MAVNPYPTQGDWHKRLLFLALGLLTVGCHHAPQSDLAQKASTRKEATALLARDTQRIAKRRNLTWLSNEPLLSWSKTPVTVRMASERSLSRVEAEQLARDILQSVLWSCNSQKALRDFANHELGRQDQRPIEWDELALKISFWDPAGERYPPPATAQLVVQKGAVTTWLADPSTHRVADPVTRALTPPVQESWAGGVRPDPAPSAQKK